MTLRQLFASATRFLGFAPKATYKQIGDTRDFQGPKHFNCRSAAPTDKSAAELVDEWRAARPDVVAVWDQCGDLAKAPLSSLDLGETAARPRDYSATELAARAAHQGALADHAQACEDWVRAGCPTTANPQLDIYREALAPFGVDVFQDKTGVMCASVVTHDPRTFGTPPEVLQDRAEKHERVAARHAGPAYWVEGPKADGLFWLYHRKTPDDLAEPVRGYTRRRNAQARADELEAVRYAMADAMIAARDLGK